MQRLKDVWAETSEGIKGEGGNEGPHLRLNPDGAVREASPSHTPQNLRKAR